MKIKINESKLRKIISDTIISETSRRQKAERAVNNQNTKIKTYAILTANNPMANGLPRSFNNRLNEKLKAYLKVGNFVWFPVKGKYGGKEDSFIVYNISLSDALHLGEKFEQESIIWCDNETGEKQYWEQNGNGEFQNTHTRNNIEDMNDADDYYTQISRNKKFQIPFFDGNDEGINEMIKYHNKVLEETINYNLIRNGLDESYEHKKVQQMLSNSTSGRGKWEARGNIYGGYHKFC